MAIEARHLHLFHPQLIGSNRGIMNPIEANTNLYNTHTGYSSVLPLSGTTTTTDALLPAAPYNSLIVDSVISQKTAIKSDSGLTYNVPVSRKRSRDSINYPVLSYPATPPSHKNCTPFSFLGEDISLQIQQQQLDTDCLISQHMQKVRMELEEKRKRQARRIIEAIEVGMMKSLKAKEEEMEKIGRLNWALEEKVKSLCVENQIWRDLAQTNEATANALRTNLEQVLTQIKDVDRRLEDDDGAGTIAAPLMDDAESCCGSSGGDDEYENENEEREKMGKDRDEEGGGGGRSERRRSGRRMCRNCGKEESCVLILPCRHLCLCTVCGSTLHTCPVCKSFKNASVHVNMS